MTHPGTTSQKPLVCRDFSQDRKEKAQKSIFKPRGEKEHNRQETKVCLCMGGNEITAGEGED